MDVSAGKQELISTGSIICTILADHREESNNGYQYIHMKIRDNVACLAATSPHPHPFQVRMYNSRITGHHSGRRLAPRFER